MIIDVLNIAEDGTQTLTSQDVPDDYFNAKTQPTETEQLRADVDYLAVMEGVDL